MLVRHMLFETVVLMTGNQYNKQNGIVNKVFVEMLEKLGYDIQITYVKKETNV